MKKIPSLLFLVSTVALLNVDIHSEEKKQVKNVPKITIKTHVYKEIDGHKVHLDVHRLEGDAAKRPVLLNLHGGALIAGGRYFPANRRDMWIEAGYVVVSIDYRLAPQVKIKDQYEDVQDAYTWVIKNGPKLFNADVENIVVGGASAGGYLSMAAGAFLKPTPKAIFSLSGYGDIMWYLEPHYQTQKIPAREAIMKSLGDEVKSSPRKSKERSQLYISSRQKADWIQLVTGLDPKKQSDEIEAFRTILHITENYPPIVMVHSEKDNDVPYSQSTSMGKALKKKRVDHILITVPGGHCSLGKNEEEVAMTAKKVMSFLKKHLSLRD